MQFVWPDTKLEITRNLGHNTGVCDGYAEGLTARWLGPPRPRITAPDSRSMLCTEPYERPVEAARFRMLAPFS